MPIFLLRYKYYTYLLNKLLLITCKYITYFVCIWCIRFQCIWKIGIKVSIWKKQCLCFMFGVYFNFIYWVIFIVICYFIMKIYISTDMWRCMIVTSKAILFRCNAMMFGNLCLTALFLYCNILSRINYKENVGNDKALI